MESNANSSMESIKLQWNSSVVGHYGHLRHPRHPATSRPDGQSTILSQRDRPNSGLLVTAINYRAMAEVFAELLFG
jgi:hypothetical protein